MDRGTFGNVTGPNDGLTNGTTTSTTTTLLSSWPRSAESVVCDTVAPWAGLWIWGTLFFSTLMLIMVIVGLAKVGAIFAVPRLAGMRCNLFAAVWLQGIAQVLQALRGDSTEGCHIRGYLVSGSIPMDVSPRRPISVGDLMLDFAVFLETHLSGYLALLLLVALPRLRLLFCPEGLGKTKGWVSKSCALPAVVLLLLINPVLATQLTGDSQSNRLLVEMALYLLGTCLAWVAGRSERTALASLFEHVFQQEWIVLFTSVGLRVFKLMVSASFSGDAVPFLNALVSSICSLTVLTHLLLTTTPWRDPLVWLAAQDWTLARLSEPQPDAGSGVGSTRTRRAGWMFGLSVCNFPRVLALVLRYQLERFGLCDAIFDSEDPELELGRTACIEWSRWAEKVVHTWPGLEAKRTADRLDQVVPPVVFTEEEMQLHRAGKLTRRTKWVCVCGDYFSDRVHSQELAMYFAVAILTNPSIWQMVTSSEWFGAYLDETLAALVQTFAACLFIWFGLSCMMVGNNVFLPCCCCSPHVGRRIWLVFLLIELATRLATNSFFLLYGIPRGIYGFFGDRTSIISAGNTSRTMAFGFYTLQLWLAFMGTSCVFRLLCMERATEARNTHHRLEFAAQRYCQRLLEGELRGLRGADAQRKADGQIFQVSWCGGHRPCRVTRTHPDGTCSLVLQGGQRLENVLWKELMPLKTDARLVKEERSELMRLMSVMVPALHRLRQDAGTLANGAKTAVSDVLRAVPQSPKSFSDFRRLSFGQQALDTVVAQVSARDSEQVPGLELEPQRSLKEEDVDDALVTVACDEGNSRAQHLRRQRLHSQGFRLFFMSFVGLPGLMLLALVVGPLLILGLASYLAKSISRVEANVGRFRSIGAYALRVHTLGFHLGACSPPSVAELEACIQALGKGPCSPPVPMLFWAYDHDRSGLLEPVEIDRLSTSLAGLSSAARLLGRERTVLRRSDIRALSRVAAPPGTDFLAPDHLHVFLCGVSSLLTAQAEQINGTAVTENLLFRFADRDPQDGFLSESEVQSLIPMGILDTNLYGLVTRAAFLLADTSPTDRRLSPAEADAAVSYAQRLMTTVPALLAELQAVAGGQKTALNGDLVISVMDVDGDGMATRKEASLLGSVLSAAGLSQVSGLTLGIFDRLDADRDRQLHRAEVDQAVQQLSTMLVLMQILASQDPNRITAQSLLAALDQDDSGALSQTEFDVLTSLLPSSYATQASLVVAVMFDQADTAPADGQLSAEELVVIAEQLQQLLAPPPTQSPNVAPPAPSRRLQQASQGAQESLGLSLAEILMTYSLSELFEESPAVLLDGSAQVFLGVLNSREFDIFVPIGFLCARLAIMGAVAWSCFTMMKTKSEYEGLAQRIHCGDHNFAGGSDRCKLRNSFSVSSSFPGIFLATTLLNFALGCVLIFCLTAALAVPIIMLVMPSTRLSVLEFLWPLRLVVFAALVKYLLKAVVVDRMSVVHGQPISPHTFSPLWWTLILLNFVQAPFFVVYRSAFVILGSFLSSTYLHVCAVPERNLWMDPGYHSFISLTYTQSARRNLVRTCFISALMPQAQRLRSQPFVQEGEDGAAAARQRRLRIRNRLWVAVTLWNNPEIRKDRRVSREQEFGSLKTLWDEQGKPAPAARQEAKHPLQDEHNLQTNPSTPLVPPLLTAVAPVITRL